MHGEIEVYVKIIGHGKTIRLRVDYSDTVENVKAIINDKEHILPDQQILTFDGRILQNEHSLDDCNVSNKSILDLHILQDKNILPVLDLLKTESNENLSIKLGHQKQQFQAQLNQYNVITQETVLQLEKLSMDLKLQLHIEKEQTSRLKEELNTEKTNFQLLNEKCDNLENTVISNLLERLKVLYRQPHKKKSNKFHKMKHS